MSAANKMMFDRGGVEALPHAGRRQCARRAAARGFRITARDQQLLGFVAAHRFVLACQVQALFGADRAVAYRRLGGLVRVGLLSYRRIFHAQPGVFQVTNGGLAVIDSPLLRPSIDLRTYRHDVGAAWLWLAARAGGFGAIAELWSELELRDRDRRRQINGDLDYFGVRVDGYDRSGRPRLHHPDVLVVCPTGGGVVLELELSLKSTRRLESILLGYAASELIDRVLYLTDVSQVNRRVRATVEGLGLDALVDVQYLVENRGDPRWWMWRSIAVCEGGKRCEPGRA